MYIILFFCFAYTLPFVNSDCTTQPPNFPSDIQLTVTNFLNWDMSVKKDNLWTAIPKTAEDVVQLANWAYDNEYQLRASGFMHGWSLLTITPDIDECGNIILVKTNAHLNKMRMVSRSNQVRVQTGTEMNKLMEYLEERGFGFYNIPVVGDITVGGALAIGAHGTSIPAVNETLPEGFSYGSLSSLIVSFKAVAWDDRKNAYVLKSFRRHDRDATAFFVSLGRSFLTEVTLSVGHDYNMRLLSRTDIPMDELCAASTIGRTASSFLDQTGRLEMVLFPFTDYPWIKIWSISPEKPQASKLVTEPYNFPFADSFPADVVQIAMQMIFQGYGFLTPAFGEAQFSTVENGLRGTSLDDIWGKSKNLMLDFRPTMLETHEISHAILTRRDNIQQVLNSSFSFYKNLLYEFAKAGKYPIFGPLHIRFNSVEEFSIDQPTLSVLHSLNDNRSFDVVIWFNILTYLNAPHLGEFMVKFQSFLYETLNGKDALVRPEWSKSFAFTLDGPYQNVTILKKLIPNSFPNEWQPVVSILDKYDPHGIFSNSFLDELLVA